MARDWVERRADQHDGRASLLQLTTAGHEAAARLAQAGAQTFTQLLDRIPPDQRDQVLNALEALTEALHEPRS